MRFKGNEGTGWQKEKERERRVRERERDKESEKPVFVRVQMPGNAACDSCQVTDSIQRPSQRVGWGCWGPGSMAGEKKVPLGHEL